MLYICGNGVGGGYDVAAAVVFVVYVVVGDADVIGLLCAFEQILTNVMVVTLHIPLATNFQEMTREYVALINRCQIFQKLTSHLT